MTVTISAKSDDKGKTGDENIIVLWISLMAGALLIAGGAVVVIRRRKKTGK